MKQIINIPFLIPSTKNKILTYKNTYIKNSNNFIKDNNSNHQKRKIKILFKNLRSNYKMKNIKSEGIPGISSRIFKKFFLSNKWPTVTPQKFYFILNSYYGGNIIQPKTSGKRLFYYDVNSLYPYSLINKLPIKQPKLKKFPNLEESFGFIKAVITPPNFTTNTILPQKKDVNFEENNKNWIGTYFSEELKLAKLRGYNINTIEGLIYENKENLMLDFIIYIYSSKIKHPKSTKILLNSFYGKLSSDKNNTPKFSSSPPHPKHVALLNLENKNISKYTKNLASIAIASATTSYARIYMLKSINAFNNPVQYSDTDSLVVQHRVKKNIKHHKKIGLFKNIIYTQKENKSFLNTIKFKKPRAYDYSTTKNIIISKGTNNLAKTKPESFFYPITINNKLINSIYIIELI